MKKLKHTSNKLNLKKFQISKMNNLNFIIGGGVMAIDDPGTGNNTQGSQGGNKKR